MKKLIAIAFAAGMALTAPLSVQAATTSHARPDLLILVAGGCGRDMHRGPHGGCLRNWERPAMHACPRGYHMDRRWGRCRRNW